ncbi:MAG: hypothetical protein ACTTJV_06440 [Ottowia sp.]
MDKGGKALFQRLPKTFSSSEYGTNAMKKSAPALFIAVCALFSAVAFAGPVAPAKYTVYCANGKIEVDMRNLESMRSARGRDTYALREFTHISDARKFAANMGGIGSACPK